VITLFAPAKLTWYLEVTGTRADGYHLVRSEMLSVGLVDQLVLEEGLDYLRVIGGTDVPVDDANLVRRALAVVGRRAGVTLEKRIPTGGGLGGGSSDAAAILRWAGGVDAATAATLGGDVPFCQVGGRALVEGIGDLVTPLAFVERDVTLLMPDFAVATGPVYRAYDELVREGDRPEGRNHLEAAACRVEPRLGAVLAWARATWGEAHLAGSGSTIFLEGHVFDTPYGDVPGPVGRLKWYQTVATPAA
jgi:4-diphosphocytidyl-2-C-methyl-D-erythritol kinase